MRVLKLSMILPVLLLSACVAESSEPMAPSHQADGHGHEGDAVAQADEHGDHDEHGEEHKGSYTCSMHPEVDKDAPGSCPICGMTLIQKKEEGEHREGGDHHAEGGMDGMGGHMGHMNEVKTALQAKLGAAYDQPVPGLDKADAKAGAEIFAQTCTACHGTGGAGDGPAAVALTPKPANFTDDAHSRFYSDAGRVEIIRNGIPLPGSPMAGFGAALSDKELLDLYAYVVSLRVPSEMGHGDHGSHH